LPGGERWNFFAVLGVGIVSESILGTISLKVEIKEERRQASVVGSRREDQHSVGASREA